MTVKLYTIRRGGYKPCICDAGFIKFRCIPLSNTRATIMKFDTRKIDKFYICWFVFPWFTLKRVFSNYFWEASLLFINGLYNIHPSLKIILYVIKVFVVLFWSLRVPCWNHNCLKHFWSVRANCYRISAEARFSPTFQTGHGGGGGPTQHPIQ